MTPPVDAGRSPLDQRCLIDGPAADFRDVVDVLVPGIYPKGTYLPRRLARLYRPAAQDLDAAMIAISAAGGQLFFSDMFRTGLDQARAHQRYLVTGPPYSPPSGGSMHEAGRAIDIDPGDTGIGLEAVKRILARHGWSGIAAPGHTECWHHDWRGSDGQAAYESGGVGMSRYRAMARYCIGVIGNAASIPQAAAADADTQRLQQQLNSVLGLRLAVDGIYGPATRAAVCTYQRIHGLLPDGIAGPITRRALETAH